MALASAALFICLSPIVEVIADFLFTAPAVIIQLITGIALVYNADYDFSENWIKWAIILYFFTILCWLPVVWLQIQMRNMARYTLKTNIMLSDRYWLMDKWWITLGCFAFAAIMVIFYLMIFKPSAN